LNVRSTDDLAMPDAALESAIDAEAERVDRVNYEPFVCANDDGVLVVVEGNVCYVFTLLELGAERGEVCLRNAAWLNFFQ